MINAIDSQTRAAPGIWPTTQGTRTPSTPFSDALASTMRANKDIRFSAHATQRLADRKISLTQSEQAQMANAVDKAAAKGARETLLLMDKLAFVVSVPNRTVITAMSQQELRDTVFTNIDSAVLVAPESNGPSVN